MKPQSFTFKTFILLLFIGFTFSSQLSAQCNIPNPTEANQSLFQIDWEGKWNLISLYGDWGEDYFSFYAETGKTYVFSTLPNFGGNAVNINNDDTQFTVLDANNQPAPGLFNNAFHDDFAPAYSEYRPTFAWSPTQTGTYRLLVTTYNGFLGGCTELTSGQAVTVAFRRIPRTHNFAVWTADKDTYWGEDYCWLSRGYTGQPGMGLSVALDKAYTVIDSDGGASIGIPPTHVPGPYVVTETFQYLIIGPRTTLHMLPYSTMKVKGELIMPSQWDPFSFYPSLGKIQSTDQNFPGTIHLTGTNCQMSIPNNGQLQHLKLIAESGQNMFINGMGSPFEGESIFSEIEMKGTADLYIGGKVRVKNKVEFYTDQVISISSSDPYSYLFLEEQTQIVGADENRFFCTSRPVIKEWSGTQPFFVPIGAMINATKYYAPVQVEPSSSSIKQWHCSYKHDNPQYHAMPQNGGIDHVSRYDQWTIRVNDPQAQAKLSFQWNPASYVSSQINELTTTGHDSNGAWHNLGGNNPVGGIQVGQITTNTITPEAYEYFSLASTTSNHGFRLGQQPTAEISFSCYPNPAASQTQIKLSQPAATALSLRLLDAKGSIVHGITIPAGQTEAPLQISHLSAGIYYLISDGHKEIKPFKLVKE